MSERKRVVITGIGVLSPIGNSLGESWRALRAGKSGIGPIGRFDSSDIEWKAAGELRGFKSSLGKKELRRLDPFVHYAYEAASMAIEDSGLKAFDSACVIVGSGRGGISTIEESLNGRPTAYLMSGSTVSMGASFVAQKFGIRGHTLGISTACASGAHAIGEAFRLIGHGLSGAAVAGGAEAPICRLCVAGYGLAGALSKRGLSRPFDSGRDGFVLSEGAAMLVLEEYGAALGRGARIYGEIAGYGNAGDAFHQTMPDKKGQAAAMRAALKEAGIEPARVDYISAHATSTHAGDMTEVESIKLVFGEATRIPVSANKSETGHMLGASGAFEAAMALMSIKEGLMPPTINLKAPEGGLNYVRGAIKADVKTALSTSFGFGGVNAALLFRAV